MQSSIVISLSVILACKKEKVERCVQTSSVLSQLLDMFKDKADIIAQAEKFTIHHVYFAVCGAGQYRINC